MLTRRVLDVTRLAAEVLQVGLHELDRVRQATTPLGGLKDGVVLLVFYEDTCQLLVNACHPSSLWWMKAAKQPIPCPGEMWHLAALRHPI